MILRIVGINHVAPLHRQRLEDWYVQCRKMGYGDPCFLATEWDEETFSTVIAQRERFREMLKEKWPQAPEEFINNLTFTLAYEGDTHARVYPQVEILWLDQGRPAERLDKYACERLFNYAFDIDLFKWSVDDQNILQKLSDPNPFTAVKLPKVGERDKKWARIILDRIRKCDGGWAIVIVGYNHAGETDGSMRRLLETEGQQCEVTIL